MVLKYLKDQQSNYRTWQISVFFPQRHFFNANNADQTMMLMTSVIIVDGKKATDQGEYSVVGKAA